jgi:hypothetical protein
VIIASVTTDFLLANSVRFILRVGRATSEIETALSLSKLSCKLFFFFFGCCATKASASCGGGGNFCDATFDFFLVFLAGAFLANEGRTETSCGNNLFVGFRFDGDTLEMSDNIFITFWVMEILLVLRRHRPKSWTLTTFSFGLRTNDI